MWIAICIVILVIILFVGGLCRASANDWRKDIP